MTDLTCPLQLQVASCIVYILIYFIFIAVKIIILILIENFRAPKQTGTNLHLLGDLQLNSNRGSGERESQVTTG